MERFTGWQLHNVYVTRKPNQATFILNVWEEDKGKVSPFLSYQVISFSDMTAPQVEIYTDTYFITVATCQMEVGKHISKRG